MGNEIAKLLIESHNRSKVYDALLESSNIRKLGPANMQAVMLQVEDFLDSNHVYSYKNWFEGMVFDGPFVEKYWVNIKLRYEYEMMPDPKAVVRLANLGVKVAYQEIKEQVNDHEDHYWIISLRIPKTLINVS